MQGETPPDKKTGRLRGGGLRASACTLAQLYNDYASCFRLWVIREQISAWSSRLTVS